MSHRTTIRTKIKSLTALATAVSTFKKAKLTLKGKNEALITAGAYGTINVMRDSGDSYTLTGNIADCEEMHQFAENGYDDMNKLIKAYTVALVQEESAKKNLKVELTTAKNGEITMKLTGGKLTGPKSINVKVGAKGTVELDALGFEGAECQEETKFLEDKLGLKESCQCKPELAKKPKVKIKA